MDTSKGSGGAGRAALVTGDEQEAGGDREEGDWRATAGDQRRRSERNHMRSETKVDRRIIVRTDAAGHGDPELGRDRHHVLLVRDP